MMVTWIRVISLRNGAKKTEVMNFYEAKLTRSIDALYLVRGGGQRCQKESELAGLHNHTQQMTS